MKKYMVILALMLFWQAGYAQNMDKLFKEFAGKENVNRVTVGSALMKLSSLFTETMGVDNIEVLEFDNCSKEIKDHLNQAVCNLKDSRFETMLTANENKNRTKVMIRIDKEMIRELVIFCTGENYALIRIKGKIKPSDIEKVVNDNKHGC